MEILVNGAWRDVVGMDLAAVLRELGYDGAVVATAVNGQFVPAAARGAATLAPGDALEILAPMQGG